MIQLYAITDNPGPPLPEVDSLELVAQGELAAVCAPAAEGEITAETLWAHERVVERLMDDRDLVPVRYGTRVPDAQAAARALEVNRDRLIKSLEFVRGAVEISVRVLATEPEPAAAGPRASSGLEYMRARAGELAIRDDVSHTVHEPLAYLARAETTKAPVLPGELLRAAYLVDHDQVHAVKACVEQLRKRHPAWRLTCTGPWPPYSFVTQ